MRTLGPILLCVACAEQMPPAPPPAPAEPPDDTAEAPAPEQPSDWLRRGEALLKLARAGNADAYLSAREVLTTCVQQDATLAECHYLLGEACEFTDDEPGAALSYQQAILIEPTVPDYFVALAATYLRLKLYPQADQVAREGVKRVPHELKNAAGILALYRLIATVADARGDRAAMLSALEAGAREGGTDPALDFELGTAYAASDPPRVGDATKSLVRFTMRVCRGSAAQSYKQQCELAQQVLAELELSAKPGQAPAAAEQPPPEQSPAAVALSEPAKGPLELPTMPALPTRPLKDGDAFTVWGASYSLRSRAHRQDVVREGREGGDRFITITGYITKTNLPEAPKCAVHAAGRADPENCVRPVPAFWLGDTKDAPPEDCIRVLGWASNYAQLYEAIHAFDRRSPSEYIDGFWGVSVPNPLPAVGAKVTVRGTYGPTFSLATSAIDMEPHMGLLTYQSQKVLEQAPELGTLPGVARRAR